MTIDYSFELSDLIQILILVVTAIWAIAKVRMSVGQIKSGLDNLSVEVRKLDKTLDRLQTKLDDHAERIVRVETKLCHVDTQRVQIRPVDRDK